jgi:glycine/D-amino acid oxidase-like deaminating enzyme
MIESLGIWKGLARETGEDVGFTQGGCLYLGENAEQLASLEPWLETARQFGLDTRLLTARAGHGAAWRERPLGRSVVHRE